jgi:hypothetical protein
MKLNLKNIFSEKRDKIVWITVYNLLVTLFLYLFFLLIQTGLTNIKISEISILNSIIIIVASLFAFIIGFQFTFTNFNLNNTATYYNMVAGNSNRFYFRQLIDTLILILFEIIITFIILTILINPGINIIMLPVFLVYIMLVAIIFINLGNITGVLTKKSPVSLAALPVIILLLYIVSGPLAALEQNPILYSIIIKYFPAAMVLKGGTSTLLQKFNEVVIPLIYVLGLDILTSFITILLLKREN